MNTNDVFKFFGEMGWRFSEKSLVQAYIYMERMVCENRCAIFEENGKIIAIMLFALCNNPDPYLSKPSWKYKRHNKNGRFVVVERLVSRCFNKFVLYQIEDFLVSNFPSIQYGVWRRYRKNEDKVIVLKRSIYHAKA